MLDGTVGALEVGLTVEEPDVFSTAAAGGAYAEVWDRVSGQLLDGERVHKARDEEMVYMRMLKVFEYAPLEEAREATGRAPISVDGVDVDKGDDSRPEYRSRLVAQETKWVTSLSPEDVYAVFAATPPLEALRFILSCAMTEMKEDRSADRVIAFLDISRAHLHSPVRRAIYVKACKEDIDCPEGHCWKLLKAMYGLKDAGAAFDAKAEATMLKLGFTIGLFSPCLCYNSTTGVACFRYGDDFVPFGRRAAVQAFIKDLGEELIVKTRGTLGARRDLGDVGEIVILNRIVRWMPATSTSPERIEMEADSRHVALLAQQLGLQGQAKVVVTPGVKHTGDRGDELDADRRQTYRSAAMRLSYLAQDRPDVCFATKEIARDMATPDEAAWTAFTRIVRFLLGHRRLVWTFARQGPVSFLDLWSDADHAGCVRTRRSTSCSGLMMGGHLLRFSATTQTVLALSTGESEFYGLVKGGSIVLGAVEMAKDLGVMLKARMRYDATAGAGIASRRGVGKARHLHTPCLWLQKHIQDRRIELMKVDGLKNWADAGTKHLDAKSLWKCVNGMNVYIREGESQLALKVRG